MARFMATHSQHARHAGPQPGPTANPMPPARTSSATSAHWRPNRSTSCARWRPSSSAACCSRAARTPSSCCTSRARRSFRPRLPSRWCTSTPGRNFPEVLDFRDRTVEALGLRLVVGHVQDDIDAGGSPRRWARVRPATSSRRRRCCVRSANTSSTPSSEGLVATRRRHGPRSGSTASATSTGVGSEEPTSGALEPVQWAAPQGRAHPGVSAVQLDRARCVAVHRR